jgi:CRP-like cAMP-binding protein
VILVTSRDSASQPHLRPARWRREILVHEVRTATPVSTYWYGVALREHPELDRATTVSALFDRFGEVDLEGAVILAAAPTRRLPAGSSTRADTFRHVPFLIVEEGYVVIRRATREWRGVVVCYAGAGALLMTPDPVESLDALVEAQATLVSEETYASLLARPDTAKVLSDALRSALRQKRDSIANLAGGRPVERVERTLLQLAREHGRVVRDGVRLDFPVTHELLAEMIGSARETVSRAIEHLERAGFLVREGRSYRLLVTPDRIPTS